MFSVVYTFSIKPGKVKFFIDAWEELTNLIYKYEGSLGSRLHKVKELEYVAYAQWPDRETRKNSGDKLPTQAKKASSIMKDACISIETVFELPVVKDLLRLNVN